MRTAAVAASPLGVKRKRESEEKGESWKTEPTCSPACRPLAVGLSVAIHEAPPRSWTSPLSPQGDGGPRHPVRCNLPASGGGVARGGPGTSWSATLSPSK